jgi:hypothetical protein
MSTTAQLRRDMSGNGLSELNGGVVAGEDDAVAGCHGEVVPFPEAIWAAWPSWINSPPTPTRLFKQFLTI